MSKKKKIALVIGCYSPQRDTRTYLEQTNRQIKYCTINTGTVRIIEGCREDVDRITLLRIDRDTFAILINHEPVRINIKGTLIQVYIGITHTK